MNFVVATLLVIAVFSSINCQVSDPRFKYLNDGKYRSPVVPTTPAPVPFVRKGSRWVHLGKADVGNDWTTVREKNALAEKGYDYGFETKTGVQAAETGSIVDRGTADESLRSEGYYQFTADDGVVYRVDYVAVANGYVNAGQPLPKSQSAIIRALEYISKNPNVQW